MGAVTVVGATEGEEMAVATVVAATAAEATAEATEVEDMGSS